MFAPFGPPLKPSCPSGSSQSTKLSSLCYTAVSLSVQFRRSLLPHGLQYARLPCPSATSFLLASYFVHGCVFISYPISQFIPASWDLSSPIRDGACTPCIGSTESLPMGLHQSFPFLNGVSLGFQELHVSPFSRSGLKPQHHPLALSLPYCQPHITFQAC